MGEEKLPCSVYARNLLVWRNLQFVWTKSGILRRKFDMDNTCRTSGLWLNPFHSGKDNKILRYWRNWTEPAKSFSRDPGRRIWRVHPFALKWFTEWSQTHCSWGECFAGSPDPFKRQRYTAADPIRSPKYLLGKNRGKISDTIRLAGWFWAWNGRLLYANPTLSAYETHTVPRSPPFAVFQRLGQQGGNTGKLSIFLCDAESTGFGWIR